MLSFWNRWFDYRICEKQSIFKEQDIPFIKINAFYEELDVVTKSTKRH
jgi:hypothetical protein